MPGLISVLLIDDERSILEITKIFIEREGGISIDTALSAEEGLGKIEANVYDVIISDYDMPGRDGIWFLKELRGSGDNTPFIMFTGRGRESVAIEALNSGATLYLQKGGDPKAQFADLRNAIIQTAQRKFAEEEVLKARDFLDNIINSIADPVFVKDHAHRWILLNDAYCDLMGYPRDQLIDRTDHDFFQKNEADKFWIRDDLVFTNGEENIYEDVFTDSSGRSRYTIIKEKLYTDIHGEKYLVGVISDVTGMKETEKDLRIKDQAIQSAMIGIVFTDADSGILYANPVALEMAGFDSEAEVIGKSAYGFIEDRQVGYHAHQAVVSTGRWQGEARLLRKDGASIYVLISAGVVRDRDGRPICNMISFLDISREKKTELALMKRNEELERFERIEVGREMLVVELKNRVDKLEEELGRCRSVNERYRETGR